MQVNNIDIHLKSSLWNVITEELWPNVNNQTLASNRQEVVKCIRLIWKDYFKLPIDNMPYNLHAAIQIIRKFYFDEKTMWYSLYNFLEYLATMLESNTKSVYRSELQSATSKYNRFINNCNQVLQKEMSGYRFIDNILTPITSDIELDEIVHAIEMKDQFSGVSVHLKQSLSLLSDKQNPDFRNSIKESISAIESLCKVITENPKGTLGEGLKKLEQYGITIHPSLKEAFNKLYGYSSDEKGIRHALLSDIVTSTFDEAKFMLVTCSAFCNYVISIKGQNPS